MKPWIELDRATVPGGGILSLHQHDTELTIRIDGHELMGTRRHASEERLAEAALNEKTPKDARVLIGGLGIGYTIRATLDRVGPRARVDVAELVPAVVRWNRGILAPFAGRPLEDRRVHVIERDVADILRESKDLYDAILLDTDNGPAALTVASNKSLYNAGGLAVAVKALRPKGVLAVWSASDEPSFTARLQRCGFNVTIERPAAHGTRGLRHFLWLAQRR